MPPISAPRGLTTIEADAARRRVGPNVIVPERERARAFRWIVPAVADPMVVLLVVASVTYLLLGDRIDAIITLVAIIPLALIGIILERRAERALDALKKLTAPTARAWRDGQLRTIPIAEVVPGDLLEIQEGDIVPADGAYLAGGAVTVDESALTGESQPVLKTERTEGDDGRLFAGTIVTSGRGGLLVDATGPSTRYGQVAGLVARVREPRTPLQQSIRRLITQLGVLALALCGTVVAIALARGSTWGDAVIAGVSLAIAAIPEEFPLVFTLYLSLGAWRLARDKALVRRLVGVETLGSTTVICADKTGTLTRGMLELGRVAFPDGTIHEITADLEPARALLAAAIRASEPEPYDPLERAILLAAREAGLEVKPEKSGALLHDHPFDPKTKSMAHVWKRSSGAVVSAKGAPEGILSMCDISPAARERVLAANHALADAGMRVIAVAERSIEKPSGDRARDVHGLELRGLLAFRDPPRAGVKEALEECQGAGIRVVMITGDHPVTAHAIAEGLGMPHEARRPVVTGEELDVVTNEEFATLARETNIFARVRPEQKHRLVQTLRAQGDVVAMTGDGINDAPALRAADIGIAMGERGTQVARESATLVLLDDNFSTIVRAVRDGRRLFANLQRAFGYVLAFHPPLLLAALVIPLLDKPLLLLPLHLVWLEIVMHPTASIVFEAEPAPPDTMTRPPRRGSGNLLRKDILLNTMIPGLVLSGASIGIYLWSLTTGSVEHARAQALATMIVGQALLVLVARADDQPFWRIRTRNRTLFPVLGLTILSAILAVHLPAASRLLSLAPLVPGEWLLAAALGSASVLFLEPVKAIRGRKRPVA